MNHDPIFGQELRRAAVYVPSRNVLYALIEADRLRPKADTKVQHKEDDVADDSVDRTYSLIDNFLNTAVPEDKSRRKHPTADAATDYMTYLEQMEEEHVEDKPDSGFVSQMYGQAIIDDFLEQGKIQIKEHADEDLQKPQISDYTSGNHEIFTETLARIYIKQGKYDKALEIIQRLSLKYPKKNRYFADQIRYLEKLIVNNNNK